jgi:transcriptional regulator with XRE-family HTH domain
MFAALHAVTHSLDAFIFSISSNQDGRSAPGMPIVIKQVRAARELLNWTQARLAEAAGINLSIIKNFESEQRLPTQENLLAIWRAFRKAGIQFESDRKFVTVKVRRSGRKSFQAPIDPRQSRAARKLLDWGQPCLSRIARISLGAIRNFEGEHRPTAAAKISAILHAFKKTGIVFEDDGKFVAIKVRARLASSSAEASPVSRRAA